MESYYNCLSVKADNFLWLLQDKALEITGEAIEEVKDGFIIRTEKDIEPIKSQLIAYAQELETIMSESINMEFSEQTLKNQDWIANYRDSITPIVCGKYYIQDILQSCKLGICSNDYSSYFISDRDTVACLSESVRNKILNGEDITIALCGDSIGAGADTNGDGIFLNYLDETLEQYYDINVEK